MYTPRTEDSRERTGTPDLRYGARTRGVALPLVQMSRRAGTQVTLPFVIDLSLCSTSDALEER